MGRRFPPRLPIARHPQKSSPTHHWSEPEALIGFCETTSCRRQALLGYFGERKHPPCGNCDNGRYPVASWYGTIAAQKARSGAYRTGQRFGAHRLVDVLVGNAIARIRDLGHHRPKTFGVGTELDGRRWLSVIRQLLAQGLLLPDPDGHGGWRSRQPPQMCCAALAQCPFVRKCRASAERRPMLLYRAVDCCEIAVAHPGEEGLHPKPGSVPLAIDLT